MIWIIQNKVAAPNQSLNPSLLRWLLPSGQSAGWIATSTGRVSSTLGALGVM